MTRYKRMALLLALGIVILCIGWRVIVRPPICTAAEQRISKVFDDGESFTITIPAYPEMYTTGLSNKRALGRISESLTLLLPSEFTGGAVSLGGAAVAITCKEFPGFYLELSVYGDAIVEWRDEDGEEVGYVFRVHGEGAFNEAVKSAGFKLPLLSDREERLKELEEGLKSDERIAD